MSFDSMIVHSIPVLYLNCKYYYIFCMCLTKFIGLNSMKVDDVLETKLEQQFQLVLDKGTLDAIGLHPDGPVKRYE